MPDTNTARAQRYLAQNLSNDEYNTLLANVVRDHHGADSSILDVPGAYESLADHYAVEMMGRHIRAA